MFGSRPDRRTHGARAVVTGAGSGIGRAFALELARRGGSVICADIDVDRAQETATLVEGLGSGSARAVFCDVSRTEDIDALADLAADHFGAPTSLMINNAGVGIGGRPVGEIGLADWQWALGINLWGMVYGSERFLPQLRQSGRAGLINVASTAAFSAAPAMAAYNVGKAGVLALSETIAAESGGTDLAVTVLCPTFVKTNVAVDGRIAGGASQLAQTAMRWTGVSADRVARTTLDAHDHGRLYVVPQPDARLIWAAKRHLPRTYTAGLGLLNRAMPALDRLSGAAPEPQPTRTGV